VRHPAVRVGDLDPHPVQAGHQPDRELGPGVHDGVDGQLVGGHQQHVRQIAARLTPLKGRTAGRSATSASIGSTVA